jgi:hypothetical protein
VRHASTMRFGLVALALLLATAGGAAPASANTTLLPMPGAFSCGAADYAGTGPGPSTYPGDSAWTLRRLTVTSSATITAAQALMAANGSTQPTVIDIRANDGTVGTSSWTIVGTLSQSSSEISGSRFLVSYTGSVTVSPGTYWVGARAASAAATSQRVCVTSSPSSQSPWSVSTTVPRWYQTPNNGTSFSIDSGVSIFEVPFISLSASGASGSANESESSPSPIVQGVAAGSSPECTRLSRPDLNWAGVASGGWAYSWGEWANSGRGGFVCVRTLVFRNGAWAVE